MGESRVGERGFYSSLVEAKVDLLRLSARFVVFFQLYSAALQNHQSNVPLQVGMCGHQWSSTFVVWHARAFQKQ